MTSAYQNLSQDASSFSPEAMQAIYMEEMKKLEAENAEKERQIKALARSIEGMFNTDAAQRQRKESEWYWAERLMLGSMWRYWNRWSTDNSDNPFETKDRDFIDDDKPEFNIVKPKIRIGQAQLEMMQFGAGTDKNFDIKARKPVQLKAAQRDKSPVFHADGQTPMVGPDGQQMTLGQLAMKQSQQDDAQAAKMDELVWGYLQAVDYGRKMRLGIQDMLWYGTAIFKGPFNNSQCKKVRYQVQGPRGPMWIAAYTEEPAPDFERVTPWLFYPDHRALSIDEAEHATQVHIYTPTQLRQLIKRDGFRQEAIAELLKEAPRSNYYQAFRARAVQYNNSKFLDNKYVALEWHGTVGIDDLGRLGIEPPYTNPFDMYKAEVWVCQGEVIYACLEMLEADNQLPFAVCAWEPDPASLFGFGAIMLRDAQRVVNMTYQMVLDNAGLSAGPMVVLDKESIKPIDGKFELTPLKVFYWTESGVGKTVDGAVSFINVPNNNAQLMDVLNMARDFGNEESMVPLIAGGLEDPSVGDTGATGMALRLQSSTTVLSSKARSWDDNITKRTVGWFYEWCMQYSDREDAKGDYDVDVQTSTAYLNKVIGQRDIERLMTMTTQDPDLGMIIDRTAAARAMVMGMNLPADSIVRDEETVDQLKQQAAENAKNNPDPATIKAQADLINANAHQASVQNDTAQLEFDKEQGMVEANQQHEQAMANYKTRNNEAIARTIDSKSKTDVAALAATGKNQVAAQKIIADLHIAEQDQETTKFVAGVQAGQTQQKLDLEARNVAVKEHVAKHPKPKAKK